MARRLRGPNDQLAALTAEANLKAKASRGASSISGRCVDTGNSV